MPEDQLDKERLEEITEEMCETLTSPEFVKQAMAVRNAPEEERLVKASERLSVEGLREAGLNVPNDMRISSRYFEDSFDASVELGDYPECKPNIVNELNEVEPGFLDKLRRENPDIFRELITTGRPEGEHGLGSPVGGELAWGACAGGGAATICGCAGFST